MCSVNDFDFVHETWKDVIGFEGMYLVSNTGKIKNAIKNTILNPGINSGGYPQVGFFDKYQKKYVTIKVHKIVAMAFIPNLNNFPQINHIDGNKQNNCVENLEWCTSSHNNRHRHVLNPDLFKGENSPCSKYSNEQILETYNLAWEGTLSYPQISEKCGVDVREIYLIKYGKQWVSVTKHEGDTHSKRFSGEENRSSKLTEKQVLEIYDLAWNTDLTNVEIGKRYNVNRENIRCIKEGITWSQVTKHTKRRGVENK